MRVELDDVHGGGGVGVGVVLLGEGGDEAGDAGVVLEGESVSRRSCGVVSADGKIA